MRQHAVLTALMATPLLFTGCMRQNATTSIEPSMNTVAVRFMVPQFQDGMMANANMNGVNGHTGMNGGNGAELVVDNSYDGFSNTNNGQNMGMPASNMRHVAVWGNSFDGTDVTGTPAFLTPGSYMFAFVDPEHSDMIQGWVEVNATGNDMLDVLNNWKSSIPEQKRMLAFNFDINGRLNTGSVNNFADFQTQLTALNELEMRINETINAEAEGMAAHQQGMNAFVNSAELLIIPGETSVFHPTTQAAFTPNDIATVREGTALTKIVLVADYDEAKWKMKRINRLYGDLSRYQTTLKETLERLERKKGMFLLTDHLHNHDKAFVNNERQMQYILGEVDRLTEDMNDLRERRMAMAFVTELVAPDGTFDALNQEKEELTRELAVVRTQKQHMDALFEAASNKSSRRVAFERNRQRFEGIMDAINTQLMDLTEARAAMETMVASTSVIHRQGDNRLLTSVFAGSKLPFRIRHAVEQESLMTVRMESSDSVFVPKRATAAMMQQMTPTVVVASSQPVGTVVVKSQPMKPQSTSTSHMHTSHGHMNNDWDTVATNDNHATMTSGQMMHPQHTEPMMGSMDDMDKEEMHCTFPSNFLFPPCWFHGTHAANGCDAYSGRTSGFASTRSSNTTDVNAEETHCMFPGNFLFPPCWFHGSHTASNCDANTDHSSGLANAEEMHCPFPGNFLFPPCWFHGTHTASACTAVGNGSTKLASTSTSNTAENNCPPFISLLLPRCWMGNHTASSTTTSGDTFGAGLANLLFSNNDGSGNNDCPPLIRLLVPPCWMGKNMTADSNDHDGTQLAAMSSDSNNNNDEDSSNDDEGCSLPLLFKLLVPPCWFAGN